MLDTSLGKPAAGVPVSLRVCDGDDWRTLSEARTDADGRVRDFSPAFTLTSTSYQLVFDTAAYFRSTSRVAFFERVTLEFTITDASQHHHVPLLLTPFGYSTYRGS
ncbi:MAG: hydroxyisourate hydrolase [Polyangiaceae bacterium]